jgi:hypothetical protein
MFEDIPAQRIEAPRGTRLVRALLAADRAGLERRLAGQVRFNSPIRRYERRDEVEHLMGLLGSILPGAQIERSWRGAGGAVTIISAIVDGARLDGMVEELCDGDARVREVTLMLRPHSAMMLAIKRMAAALEQDPFLA